MNKTQSFAQVILAGIGIFFAIRIITQMTNLFAFVTAEPSLMSLGMALIWFLVFALALVAVCYIFIYKREPIAKKIVGEQKAIEPETQIPWLPAAFRLVCVFAGLHCVDVFIWRAIHILIRYLSYLRQHLSYQPETAAEKAAMTYIQTLTHRRVMNLEDGFLLLILLAAAVYLLWGAPHFVRWQVRKTLEQCKEMPQA